MDISKLTYEEAMAKLETILKELEDNKLTLKESLNKFKEGMALYEHCNRILTEAEGEIKLLVNNKDEPLDEVDFVKEVDDYYC